MAIAIATNTPLNIPLSRSIYKLLLAEPITAYDVARIDKDFARHRYAQSTFRLDFKLRACVCQCIGLL